MHKILIIEDEFLIAYHIKQILKTVGYENIHTANTYDKSIYLIETLEPDLILIDIQLFEDSDAGLRIALYLEKNFNIPFIFLTAHVFDSIIHQAKLLHPANYIIKPFDETQLKIAINMALPKENLFKRKGLTFKGKHINAETEEALNRVDLSKIDFVSKGIYIKDIVFIQTFNHIKRNSILLALNTPNSYFLVSSETIENILKTLSCEFIQIHKSYIVNKNFISHSKKNEYLELTTGQKIPLGLKYHLDL